jgi:DNA polymerase III epsilon subunit-like protein
MKKYELYTIDTETTSIDPISGDILEISICRMSNNEQKTWCMFPLNKEGIQPEALRVNGHKIEDILHQTSAGKERYLDPKKVIVEIENWLMEDFLSSEERVLTGQNIFFDRSFMLELWKKCEAAETFPFNKRHLMDTMMLEFAMDHIKGEYAEGYSLYALTKKYGIVNKNAHSAAADVRATVSVFNKQIAFLKAAINKE